MVTTVVVGEPLLLLHICNVLVSTNDSYGGSVLCHLSGH